jgi:hypothetical protein
MVLILTLLVSEFEMFPHVNVKLVEKASVLALPKQMLQDLICMPMVRG